MSRAALSPLALRELRAAARWIAKDNPAAARAFRAAVAEAANRIGEHPLIGVRRPELAKDPFRFVVLTGFPYLVVYYAERTPPVIARIVHGARDLPTELQGLIMPPA
jgi:toxin ParE1/3/4